MMAVVKVLGSDPEWTDDIFWIQFMFPVNENHFRCMMCMTEEELRNEGFTRWKVYVGWKLEDSILRFQDIIFGDRTLTEEE
jgi:hypothetical protein